MSAGARGERSAVNAAPPSHACSRAVPKARGERSVPSRPTCGCPAWAGTRSALACRACPLPRAPVAAAGPSSWGERSRIAAAHADPCPPPPPQAALAAAPGSAETGMLEKLEFQEEGECATRTLRCRRPAPGLQPGPGEAPGSRDAAGFLGTQPGSGEAPSPREAARFPGTLSDWGGGCSPILRVAAWFRGWNRVPGDTASLRGCSPAPGNAAPLQGTQCRSRERSRIPGDAAPLPGAAARALRGTALLSSAPELESESQVSCSPNCACHRALRGHPGITRTAHAFK